jgi:hypothetical protein
LTILRNETLHTTAEILLYSSLWFEQSFLPLLRQIRRNIDRIDWGLNSVWNSSQPHSSGISRGEEHCKLENRPRAKPGRKVESGLKTGCENCHVWWVVTPRTVGSFNVPGMTKLRQWYLMGNEMNVFNHAGRIWQLICHWWNIVLDDNSSYSNKR